MYFTLGFHSWQKLECYIINLYNNYSVCIDANLNNQLAPVIGEGD